MENVKHIIRLENKSKKDKRIQYLVNDMFSNDNGHRKKLRTDAQNRLEIM